MKLRRSNSAMSRSLEIDLDRRLQRAVCIECGRYRSGRTGSDRCARICEGGVVCYVEALQTQLCIHTLMNLEDLLECCVELNQSIPEQDIAPRSAIGVLRCCGECICAVGGRRSAVLVVRIEEPAGRLARLSRNGDTHGALTTNTSIRNVGPDDRCVWRAAARRVDTGNFPSSKDAVDKDIGVIQEFASVAEWQRVYRADGKHLAEIDVTHTIVLAIEIDGGRRRLACAVIKALRVSIGAQNLEAVAITLFHFRLQCVI